MITIDGTTMIKLIKGSIPNIDRRTQLKYAERTAMSPCAALMNPSWNANERPHAARLMKPPNNSPRKDKLKSINQFKLNSPTAANLIKDELITTHISFLNVFLF